MAEFVIGGHTYKVGQMNVFAQFHVGRRLAPVLTSSVELADTLRSGKSEILQTIQAIEPLVEAISKLSDDECDYVIFKCLEACQRQQNGGWAPLFNSSAKRLMFEDITLPDMLSITARVIQENLAGFFPSATPFTAQVQG